MASTVACRATFSGLAVTTRVSLKANFRTRSKENGGSRRCSLVFAGHQRRRLEARAILDKHKGIDGQSSGSSTDPARVALERLFLQTQRLEERISDSRGNSEAQSDLTLLGLEVDLHTVIEALKVKEAELRAAELAVKAEQEEIRQAKSSLLDRERELQAAQANQSRIKDELCRTKQERCEQELELNKVKEMLKQREKDVCEAQEALISKQDESTLLRRGFLEKDEALAKAAAELQSRDLRLTQAEDFISNQSIELGKLRQLLEERERDWGQADRERQLNQEKLEAAEAELEQRAVAWLAAQGELRALEQELLTSKSQYASSHMDLNTSNVLLGQVRKELEASQKVTEDFRARLMDQEKQLAQQKDDLSRQKTLLTSYLSELKQARRVVFKERQQRKSLQRSYNQLELELNEGKRRTEALQVELQREKLALQDSITEINSLRKELQTKDSTLSDTQLSLQLKEAELVAAKLELQQVNSKFVTVQLTLKDRGMELEAVQTIVEELQKEAVQLKSALKTKEEQLVNVTSLLREREEQLNIVSINLDSNRVKLSEATSVVEQIAALSKTLVDETNQGRAAVINEETLLMQTNYELFATNRAVLEKELQLHFLEEKSAEEALKRQEAEAELETVKECLREKENELLEAQRYLALKDQDSKKLLHNWDKREAELDKMRDDAIEEAKGLTSLHTLAQSQGMTGNQSLAEATLDRLEVEAARLEVAAATSALKSLAELSQELVDETLPEDIYAKNSAYSSLTLGTGSLQKSIDHKLQDGALEVVENTHIASRTSPVQQSSEAGMTEEVAVSSKHGLESLQARLHERESALERTKNAVDNLSKLTRRLMEQAGLALNLETDPPGSCIEIEVV